MCTRHHAPVGWFAGPLPREEEKEQAAKERFSKVDARLQKMEAIKQAEIAAARKRADEAAAGRGEEFERRARQRVSNI